jgi:hypothetical protein
MLAEFVDWFDSQYTQRYGSIDCAGIVQDDMRNKMIRCPGIIIESLAKVKEILADHNYEFAPINPE